MEKEMATHSSVLAWKIPWTEEPGRLPSMGLQKVRHNLATKQQHSEVKNKKKKGAYTQIYQRNLERQASVLYFSKYIHLRPHGL